MTQTALTRQLPIASPEFWGTATNQYEYSINTPKDATKQMDGKETAVTSLSPPPSLRFHELPSINRDTALKQNSSEVMSRIDSDELIRATALEAELQLLGFL